LKSAIIPLFLAWTCLSAVPDVPVYPGAVMDEQVTKSLRKEHPDGIAYKTPDAFDKVEAFYKNAGSEDVPHTRNMSTALKYVVVRFPGKKFLIQLSWSPGGRLGTVIQLFQKP
jgi:hypothetical protein